MQFICVVINHLVPLISPYNIIDTQTNIIDNILSSGQVEMVNMVQNICQSQVREIFGS